MGEKKLLVRPAIKSLFWVRKIGYKKPLENHKSKIGIRVKNIGKKPLKESLVKKIVLHQTGVPRDNYAALGFSNEYKIKELNPGEESFIWFENAIIPFSGQGNFNLEIENPESIEIYQWDKGNNLPEKISAPGKWMDFINIKDESVWQQQITNWLIILLTLSILFITALLR